MAQIADTFTSPLANADLHISSTEHEGAGLLVTIFNAFSGWNAALTVLLLLVAYDQCEIQR